ncbi:hypothetical protein ABPG75_000258 [Micractinium tetrahymenae]
MQVPVRLVEVTLLAGVIGLLGHKLVEAAVAGRNKSRHPRTQPSPGRPAVTDDSDAAAVAAAAAPNGGGEPHTQEDPSGTHPLAEAVATEGSGLLPPAIGGSIGVLELPRWREWTGHSEGGHSSGGSEEAFGSSGGASARSSGGRSSGSGSSDGSEAAGSPANGAADELNHDAIDKAAWGCFVTEERSQEALWACRAAEAQAAAQAAAAAGMLPDWLCCRELPRNLRSLQLSAGSESSTAGGLELLVPDWWHGELGPAEVERLASLHRLLARLGSRVLLKGLWQASFGLYMDPSDPVPGFVDPAGTVWLNAARDPPGPSASAPGPSRQPAGHKAIRAQFWFVACCHLLAHAWGGGHDGRHGQRCCQVALRYHTRYQAAFFRAKGQQRAAH